MWAYLFNVVCKRALHLPQKSPGSSQKSPGLLQKSPATVFCCEGKRLDTKWVDLSYIFCKRALHLLQKSPASSAKEPRVISKEPSNRFGMAGREDARREMGISILGHAQKGFTTSANERNTFCKRVWQDLCVGAGKELEAKWESNSKFMMFFVTFMAITTGECAVCVQHTARHCNTLQNTATHCNALQHTATHCNTLRRTATYCNTLQHTFKAITTGEYTLCVTVYSVYRMSVMGVYRVSYMHLYIALL